MLQEFENPNRINDKWEKKADTKMNMGEYKKGVLSQPVRQDSRLQRQIETGIA